MQVSRFIRLDVYGKPYFGTTSIKAVLSHKLGFDSAVSKVYCPIYVL